MPGGELPTMKIHRVTDTDYRHGHVIFQLSLPALRRPGILVMRKPAR
jgi:hypothetical protein